VRARALARTSRAVGVMKVIVAAAS
jgi:hypothetical protein